MVNRLDQWFVEGWRQFWKWWSFWLHTIGTTLAAVLLLVQSMPQEIQQLIPVEWRAVAIAIWYIGGLWARLSEQKRKEVGRDR